MHVACMAPYDSALTLYGHYYTLYLYINFYKFILLFMIFQHSLCDLLVEQIYLLGTLVYSSSVKFGHKLKTQKCLVIYNSIKYAVGHKRDLWQHLLQQ